MSIVKDVFVLARSKRYNSCWSAWMERRLNTLGIPAYRVTPNARPYHSPEAVKLVINYGCGTTPIWWDRLPSHCAILNHPSQVRVSANKVLMMQEFQRVCPTHTLEFFLNKSEAQAAIEAGKIIVARTLVSSHSGRGIVLSPPDPLPDARLYTVLTRRHGLREYRVFMMNGKFMDVVQKKRKSADTIREFCQSYGVQAENWWASFYRKAIRCWDNGWSFCHNNLDIPKTDPVFQEIAEVTGNLIVWGCVDVLVDTHTKQWYMIEINTAPGLDAGNTQTAFMDSFVELYKSL